MPIVEAWNVDSKKKKRLNLEYNLGPVYMEVGDPRSVGLHVAGHPHLSCKRDQIKIRLRAVSLFLHI